MVVYCGRVGSSLDGVLVKSWNADWERWFDGGREVVDVFGDGCSRNDGWKEPHHVLNLDYIHHTFYEGRTWDESLGSNCLD